MYHVEFIESVRKTLENLDKYTQKMLLEWIEKNLNGCTNPKVQGKPLLANHVGQWRYRVGDYRIICQIEDDKLVILVISI